MKAFRVALALSIVAVLTGCGHRGLKLACRPSVPGEYRGTLPNPPPNAEPEPVRYTVAYEAFWWNCIVVRSNDSNARCPFTCSGTPASSAGCRDGGEAARAGIDGLVEAYGRLKTEEYLRSLARTDEARKRMQPYFHGVPTSEGIP